MDFFACFREITLDFAADFWYNKGIHLIKNKTA